MHNADQMKLLDVRPGDTVFVEKGGEIIPKIVAIDYTERPADSKPFTFIEKCPECHSTLIRREGEAAHYCPNESGCPPQIKGRIEHFISRNAMDIGAAEATIDLLYNKGLIRNIADLYKLSEGQIIQLERFAEKSAKNLINSIQSSKNIPFERVLFGLGIRHVGETVAKKLARHFRNLENIIQASFEELLEVDEIGDSIADSIISYFHHPYNIEIINHLKNTGLQFSISEP